jgi:hypothetical protein
VALDVERTRPVAGAGDRHADVPRRHEMREPVRPLDERDRVVRKRVVESEFARLARVLDSVEVEMLDRGRPGIAMSEHEGRACNLVRVSERARDGSDQGRLSGAEVANECDRVPRHERRCKTRRPTLEFPEVGDPHVLARGHATCRPIRNPSLEEVEPQNAKSNVMWWRANDVVVGVITGVLSAVVAALFEALFVTARFLSLGEHGGGLGSKMLVIALVGALVGGLVGFFLGAVIKPRPQTR